MQRVYVTLYYIITNIVENKKALQEAYAMLSPFSDKQGWEFDNNLAHLRFVTAYVPKTSAVLDVGCGIGILALALTYLGYKVTGVDKYVFEENNSFSVADISGLRRVWDDQGLVILPQDILRDEIGKRYDAVISIATVEHQKNPKLFLQHLLAVGRAGALIYLATPNISHLLNRVRFIFGLSPLQAHLPDFFNRGEQYEGHWREYTLAELKQMFIWLDSDVISARNVQSMRPRLSFKSWRALYVNAFRLCAYALPGARDTNIIIAKKR